jgi:hypothetical protein
MTPDNLFLLCRGNSVDPDIWKAIPAAVSASDLNSIKCDVIPVFSTWDKADAYLAWFLSGRPVGESLVVRELPGIYLSTVLKSCLEQGVTEFMLDPSDEGVGSAYRIQDYLDRIATQVSSN